MSYSFEDYDAFLASFSNNTNINFAAGMDQQEQKHQGQQLGHVQSNIGSLESNPSYSTSLSTDENDVLNSFYDFNDERNSQNLLLSPDYTSNSSNSPNDLLLSNVNTNFSNLGDFQFKDEFNQQPQIPINENIKIKKENQSSVSSTSTSPLENGVNYNVSHKVKLSNAVPQHSISKRGPKKEKSSHNMIEKRYRTNINDKIKALRDSVPALRVLVDSGDDDFDDDQLDGLQPAKKLNKATILSKATEYIRHLESKNEVLTKENGSLRARLYGVSGEEISRGNSIDSNYSSSYSDDIQYSDNSYVNNNTNNDNNNRNSNRTSLQSKLLLGGLACMVGSGLNDDLNNMDSKSLFAMPIFGYDKSGFNLTNQPFLILFKISLIFGVILNFVIPSLFKPSSKKKSVSTVRLNPIDDVRTLNTSSIWSTFSLKTGHSNNDYIKSAIFRSIWLKVHSYNSNVFIKILVDIYTNHLWNYLKQIKLDSNLTDYDYLKTILSLPNEKTINNNDYILKFVKLDLKNLIDYNNETSFKEDDGSIHSLTLILHNMINDTNTNAHLRKFMISTVTTSNSIPEIEKTITEDIDEFNVELKTLFDPTDSQIIKFKTNLESWDVSNVQSDDLFVLYSSIIQNLVFDKKDYNHAKRWFNKLDINSVKDFNLIGFTSLYITVLSMIENRELYENDKDVIFKIEELSGILRIWLGKSNGSILNFKKRSQLIDFFVNVSLKINGLDNINDGLRTTVGNI